MSNAEIERLLYRMRDLLPPLFASEGFKRDICVLSTRVVTHILNQHRIPNRVQPCQLLAFNEIAKAHIDAGENPLSSPEAHTVGIGFGTDMETRPGYDGHLVSVVKRRWLLDLTLDQVSRPQKGIVAYPAVWKREDTVADAHARFELTEGYVEYGFHDNQGFRRSGDWSTRPNDPLVRRAQQLITQKEGSIR